MYENFIALNQIPIGSSGRIRQLLMKGHMRRRILDLGFIHDTIIEPIMKSPAGDPIAYKIRGTVIALRSEEASKILVQSMG